MAKHKVYSAIVNAVRDGKLQEPFSTQDFKAACPELGKGTYNAFLYKHRRGNNGGNSGLFEKVGVNNFKLIRPIKYGLG